MDRDANSDAGMDLELQNVSVRLSGREVIADVSFRVEQGRIGVLLGPNGAGKTSLIKAVIGLIQPSAGEISIGGLSTQSMSRKQQAQHISYVPQYHLALYHYSVLDFILMGRTPHLGLFGLPGANDTRISEEVMKHLGLADLAQRSYLSLSAGERQMVLLARALVQEAPVIVMDEPTTYLDYQKQYSFMHTLKELVKARGLAALVSLHDPNLAIRFADKMIFIKNNKFLSEVDFHSGDQMVKLKRAFHAMYGGQVAIRNSEDETIACWTQKDWGE